MTTTGCSRIEDLNNKLKWNAAEWYSICCRGKVLNLQGYSIQANGFIGGVLNVALNECAKEMIIIRNSNFMLWVMGLDIFRKSTKQILHATICPV